MTSVRPMKKEQPFIHIKKDKIGYKRGLHGIAFGEDLELAFLPEEVTAYQMIKDKKINPDNVLAAFGKHFLLTNQEKIKLLKGDKEIKAYKFQTQSFYTDGKKVKELYRGHPMYKDVTSEDVQEAIEWTNNYYFKEVVNQNGSFTYSYLPQENQQEKRYNILRHAGTVYSMYETYEHTKDEQVYQEALRALDYLLEQVRNHKINEETVKVVVEKNAMKLGGNALAIIALAKYTTLTKDTQYLSIMQDLAAWISEVQNEEGRFTIHKQKYRSGEVSDFVSHFYPGESILALVRLYQIDKNEKWLDVAEKAAHYLINIRDKNENEDTIAHDHWLLYGLNELYRERSKELYKNHSFLVAEAIMKTQFVDHADEPDWLGGYAVPRTPPESTPVACRSEGLCAVYKLAKDYHQDELADRVKEAIRNGIGFQLQMQLRPESSLYYENKNLCWGAFQRSLNRFDLRIDYTQHNISSFIAFYNILTRKDQEAAAVSE